MARQRIAELRERCATANATGDHTVIGTILAEVVDVLDELACGRGAAPSPSASRSTSRPRTSSPKKASGK